MNKITMAKILLLEFGIVLAIATMILIPIDVAVVFWKNIIFGFLILQGVCYGGTMLSIPFAIKLFYDKLIEVKKEVKNE